MEYVKDIPVIKEEQHRMREQIDTLQWRQDMMFNTLGEVATDVAVIKEIVKDHDKRITVLEAKN